MTNFDKVLIFTHIAHLATVVGTEVVKNRGIKDILILSYLSTKKVTKNWTSKQPEWGEILKELEIIFEGRI